jgi:prepilin-type processing-associated H-X9-DG protein
MRAADSEEVALTRPTERRHPWGWLVAALLLAIGVPLLAHALLAARERRRNITCYSNLKEIVLALMMYTDDYGGRFPPACDWPTACTGLVRGTQLVCPSDDRLEQSRSGKLVTSYAMNAAAGSLRQDSIYDPAEFIFLFDGDAVCGGVGNVAFRHSGFVNVAFADGHAMGQLPAWLQAYRWGPQPESRRRAPAGTSPLPGSELPIPP